MSTHSTRELDGKGVRRERNPEAVLEEKVFVERRHVLKEEVRIRRSHETQNHHECVVLRGQEAVITRVPGDSNPLAAPLAGS